MADFIRRNFVDNNYRFPLAIKARRIRHVNRIIRQNTASASQRKACYIKFNTREHGLIKFATFALYGNK